MNDLQGLVEAIAAELGRPIGVDDRRFRLLAHSAHHRGQPVDPVRMAKLLRREANPRVRHWLESHGVREATDFVRVPPSPELEMVARIIVPLRFDGELLGFMALLDEPEPFTEGELVTALRYTDELGLAVFRGRQLRREERDPRARRLRWALGLGGEDGPGLEEGLDAPPLLPASPIYAAAVARVVGPSVEAAPPGWALASLGAALTHSCSAAIPGHSVALVENDLAIGAFGAGGAEEIECLARRLSADLNARLAEFPQWRGAVGIGNPVADLADLPASFEQARYASFLVADARVAAPFARWSDLGADGTISSLLDGSDPEAFMPEPLRGLIAHDDAATLVATLETYLDSGGDTGVSAAALFVHRTSLYHRLRRIEEVTGVSLSSGDGRLELHLGLRLWRMTGARHASPEPATVRSRA